MFGLGKTRGPIEERLGTVERELKQLKLDYEVLLDKVYRWMKRSQKRERDDAADGNGEAAPTLHPTVARILARRMGRRHGLPSGLPGDG